MDAERFDAMIKRFTVTRMTRLDAVRGLLAGAGLAVTGATVAAVEADAKGKGKGKSKAAHQHASAKKVGHKKGKGKGKQGQAHKDSVSCTPDGQSCNNPT